MMTSHIPVTGAAAADDGGLKLLFGGRWAISYDGGLGVWSAERRSADGRQIRVICDFSADGLAGKLADAEERA